MNEQAEAFFAEVREAFQFLEQQYDYQQLKESIKHPDERRDAIVQSIYVSSHVGVRIWWYFANAAIDVTFVELLQASVFSEKSLLFHSADPNVARAIILYDLAQVRGGHDDPDFLLKDIGNWRKWKKRSKQIETQRQEIITSLARATRTYATDILQGDTSIFSAVMEYHLERFKQLNPSMRVPGLK